MSLEIACEQAPDWAECELECGQGLAGRAESTQTARFAPYLQATLETAIFKNGKQ